MSEPDQGIVLTRVRRRVYVDSVTLLQATSAVAALGDVQDAALVMGTELNLEVLRDGGLLSGEAEGAGPNDLVIAVLAVSSGAAEQALLAAEALLDRRQNSPHQAAEEQSPRSIRSATRARPGANVALISVSGPYAFGEALQALNAGLHVFLFSDNVSLGAEMWLKLRANEQGLLVMGPDCGTSILNGVGLGFANVVRRGSIGVVGASGTGIQEVTCLLHRAGAGIRHAIGAGRRDLAPDVAGTTTLQAIELLGSDAQTETIVLVAKHAPHDVGQRVLRAATATGKRVIACVLKSSLEPTAGVEVAANLYQAARLAAGSHGAWDGMTRDDLPRPRLAVGQRQVRGLYCGGTLADETSLALGKAVEHEIVDFGDDQYTRGRAHPMIDPTLRNQAIVAAGADPRVAVLLLDIILGYGAHADSAGAALPAIQKATARASQAGRELTVMAHVVGTDLDPQGFAQQEQKLRSAGVHLFGSNHHMAVAASLVLEAAPA